MTNDAPDKTYFEYLDALRCLAFFAVFYAHTGTIFFGLKMSNNFMLNIWQKFAEYGSYGVNFFFVLSGFLITYLLLKEKSARNKISIKKFYIRRILRIWPVYFITLFFAAFILPLLISSNTYKIFSIANPIISTSEFYYFLFFLGNFYQGFGIGWASLSISVLWSVGVEEQFYLVWPWFIRWFNSKKLAIVTVLLISLSLLYKFIFITDRLANYYLPWSVGMDLAFGALLGIFWFEKKKKTILKYSLGTIMSSFLLISVVTIITYMNTFNLNLGLQLSAMKSTITEMLLFLKSPIVDGLFTLIILYYVNKIPSLYNKIHPLVDFLHLSIKKIKNTIIHWGKISYGLYAYHTTCLMLTVKAFYKIGFLTDTITPLEFFTTVLSAFLLTIFVANLSYNYIEIKFLKLKEKMQ